MDLAEGYNAHSQCWNPRSTEWGKAAFWEEIIDENALVIGNDDQPTHYWTRDKSKGVFIIDPTTVTNGSG